MKEVIVVAGATHRQGTLDEYEFQLRDADVPFYLEQLDPLPMGANSINMQRRIDFIRRVAQKCLDFQKLVITDAWDVLFYGTRRALVDTIPDFMLCSAERNCYPEPQMSEYIHGNSPWKYANNGMLAGNPQRMLEWCDAAERTADLGILDQAWFNRRLAEKSELVKLDFITRIFYVVSAAGERGELQVRNGRLKNTHYQTHPLFFHFSGGCPTDGFRKMLEEGCNSVK